VAIKIITGKPGSGKSYFALYKVILEGFQFVPKTFEWIPKKDNITLITNVEGLKVPHFTLSEMIDKYGSGSYEKFFTCEVQQLLTNEYPKIRYIIDECQRYFHSKFYNKDTFFYFQYHRHFGHDIYLVAQVWDSISKHITGLCEYEFRASPRSFSVFGEFTYHVYAGFDRVGAVRLPVNKKIFALYQSFQQDDTGKEIRPVRKYALVTVGLILLCIFGAFWFLNSFHLAGSGAPPAAASPIPAASAPVASAHTVKVNQTVEKVYDPVPYVLMYTGSFMVADQVKAIQWNGRLIPAAQFPYQWVHLGSGQIQVFLPASDAEFKNPVQSQPDRQAPVPLPPSVTPPVLPTSTTAS